MAIQNVFARREVKYLITRAQRERITAAMAAYMHPDEFGKSTVCSIYYDTPSHLLIRRSQESPLYKEKLRIRSYGIADRGDTVYIEIKKKYKHIVYKRRVGMELDAAEAWLSGGTPDLGEEIPPRRAQITREIEFFLSRYRPLVPAMFIGCEREAFYAIDDHEFRVTFDANITARDYDLTLDRGMYGEQLLDPDTVLMELKVGGALPLWMVQILSDEHIYKTKFSKYGTAFRRQNARAAAYIEN